MPAALKLEVSNNFSGRCTVEDGLVIGVFPINFFVYLYEAICTD